MAFNLMDPNVQPTVVTPTQLSGPMTTAFTGGSTSTTSGGAAGSQQSSQQTSQSGSYFSNPALVDSMARQFAGLYENVIPTYNDFMQDPVNSNVFQTQLKSLLHSLAPGEADARDQLTDRFRAAGGLRSGMHGVAGARLEGDIIGRRQNAAGTLLGQTIQQMSQLLGLPLSQMAPLIQALELQQSSSQGTSQGSSWRNPTTQSQSSSGAGGRAPTGAGGAPRPSTGATGGTGGTGGGGEDLVWLPDWTGGGWYPPNTPYQDRFYDDTYTGGGAQGDWDYYPQGGGDNTYNLNTEIDVPGLGYTTEPGDDWNDYYNYGGDEGF